MSKIVVSVMPDPADADASRVLEWAQGATHAELMEMVLRVDRNAADLRRSLGDAKARREWGTVRHIQDLLDRANRLRLRIQTEAGKRRDAERLERIARSERTSLTVDKRFMRCAQDMLPQETYLAIIAEMNRRGAAADALPTGTTPTATSSRGTDGEQ